MPDNDHYGPAGPHRLHGDYWPPPTGEIPTPRNARGYERWRAQGVPMTYEQWREANEMTDANPNTQPGAAGPDQATRHSAEHTGSYMHRPAPHLDPAPIVAVDLEKAAKEAAERDAGIVSAPVPVVTDAGDSVPAPEVPVSQ